MKKAHFLICAGLFVSAITLYVILKKGLTTNPSKVPSALIGKAAEDFSVQIFQGQEFFDLKTSLNLSRSHLAKRPTILNFWASWCVSCKEEAKFLEAFWQKNKPNVLVLGIAIQDTVENAARFANENGKTYPLALDESGKAFIDFGVYGVPESFFLDENGVIQYKEAGPVDEMILAQWLARK